MCGLSMINGSVRFFQSFLLSWISCWFLATSYTSLTDQMVCLKKTLPISGLRTSFMDGPFVLCIVCNCQGRKNQPPLSLLFCHNYYCAIYKLTSGNCTVVKINNNPTCRLTRPFCLLVFWYYYNTLE